MNDKSKQYKELAIVFTLLAAILIISYFILKEVSYPYASIALLVVGGILAIAAVICWILFGVKLKKSKVEQTAEQQAAREFTKWLENFDHLTKTAAELIPLDGDKKGFSKFGGLPVVPTEFTWPTENGKPIPFLLQLDFSEINPNGRLENFPVSGLLYFFVEEVATEDDLEYIKKLVFYENANALECAKAPHDLQTKYKEIFVAPNLIKTYPDTDDCDEALDLCCARPCGGMDVRYNSRCWEKQDRHLVGGWPSHVQNGGFMKDCRESDDDNWVLLLQIKSEYSYGDDGDFVWGDDGILYVYIREQDLIARNFDNVKLDMQCT